MDNQEYLNQISASTRPTKKGMPNGWLGKVMKSKFTLLGLIFLVALALIGVVGALVNGGRGDDKTTATRLMLHLDNTSEVIDTYQPNIKSSDLRSDSVSLKSLISSMSGQIKTYLEEKYKIKNNGASKAMETEAETERDELLSDLFEAKINGILDRVYAHKMAYEISKFMNEETQLYNSTKDSDLKGKLDTSYNSLKNLYDKFNNFSETKQ